ncbi:MAG: SH3 domain-containing protein, partial [Pricia sp.]|nr:SH3 domain-containing protein [Pricia sp.]
MNEKFLHRSILGLFLLLQTACNLGDTKEKRLLQEIHEVREQYAPDKRTALFDVHVFTDTKKYILKGESNLPDAVEQLKQILNESDLDFTNEIKILPDEELGDKIHGVVNISVANLRSNPKHSSELVTQATLGTPLKVLKKEEGWY